MVEITWEAVNDARVTNKPSAQEELGAIAESEGLRVTEIPASPDRTFTTREDWDKWWALLGKATSTE